MRKRTAISGIGAADVPDDVQAIFEELKGKTAEPAERQPAASGPMTTKDAAREPRRRAATAPQSRNRDDRREHGSEIELRRMTNHECSS